MQSLTTEGPSKALQRFGGLISRRGAEAPAPPLPTPEMFDAHDREMIPSPAEGRYVGDGADFLAVGCQLLKDLATISDLRPYERVLDIGCGIGRLAVPLTKYLSREGSYEGFDVVEHGIVWCQQHIASRYSNFRFTHLDGYHGFYNPQGKLKPTELRFPYPDRSFDLEFLFSVFTHMLPADVDYYLSEMRRVLCPGGRCFATIFLLDDESLQAVREGKSTVAPKISEDLGGYRVYDPDVADQVTFFEPELVERLLAKNGFRLRMPPIKGNWNGLHGPFTAQDYLLIELV